MFATDWALKRFLKFVLKRNLGQLLKNEVDLEQLSVQLSSGSVELRQVLLNCEAINDKLPCAGWKVTSGYVERLIVMVPYTSLSTESCVIQVEEVLLTIEPTEAQGSHGRTQGGASDTAAANPPGSYLPDYAADGVAATLSSGVQMLAGGIEQILQLLRVEARDVTVRLELPSGSSATLRVGRVGYCIQGGSSPGHEAPARLEPPQVESCKLVTMAGISVELATQGEGEDKDEAMVLCGPGDDGVSLSVRVRAGATADAGRSRAAARAPPSLQVAIEVTPLEVWLSPGQVPTVAAIISHLSEAAKQPSAAAPAEQGLSASVASLRSSQALDTLIAPGYKSLVADAILWGWGGSAAKEEEEEDIPEAEARKALGDSLHAAFPGAAPGPAGASMLARSMLAEDQLKASAEPSFLLDFRLAGVALVVALSDEPPTVEGGCPPAGQLVAEASRLDLSLQSASGGTEIELSIWSLEAREQLPLEHPDAAGPDGGLEAFGRLTSFLPNGQAQVPSPTFSGLYTPGGAWPGSGAGGPHNPTSTVYASCLAASNMTLALGGGLAASMASSFMGAGVQARGDAHSPAMLQDRSMEVWPVFVAADSDGTSEGKLPSLRAVLRQPRDRDDEAPTLDLRTGPSAVWLRMPLLRQIASLAARVSAGCAVALEPQGLGTQPEHRASRDWQSGLGAGPVALESLLDDLHQATASQLGVDEKPGLQLSFRCPHLNALVMCPNPPPSEEQIGSSLRRVFLAVDVSAARDGTELIPLISATVGSDSAASDSHGLGCEAKLGVANLSLHLAVQAHGSPGEECVDSVKIMEAPSGLIGELSWRPSRSSGEWLLYQTWEHAETKADNMSSAPAPKNGTWDNGALETVQLKDSLIMSSALLINLQASLLNSHMGHEQMAALAGTMAGFAAEQAAASELGYTTASPHERLPQISLLLQCAMHSDVSGKTAGLGSDAHASAPDAGEDKDDTINDFHAALGDLHLLWVANLGGQQFASAALVQAADLSLAGGSQVPACLAWCPRLQQAGKEPHMGLTVFTVTCPFGISREETRLGNMASSQPNFRADNGRQCWVDGHHHPVSLQTTTAIAVSGLTVSCYKGDLSMSWAGDLARCLQAVQQDPGVLAALPPSPRVVHSQISLHVLDVALRYDPAAESPSNAVASVLLIGGLKWGSTTGIQTQEALLSSMALYLAEAANRPGDWSPWSPMHVPGISLAAEQYILLAQESCLTVSITVAGDQPGSGPGFQPWQVCLRNQKLCVTTCPKRLVLLHGLAAQLSIGNGNESSARQDAATTPRRETPSGNDDCATGILGDLVEDMYNGAGGLGQSKDVHLAASVFMAGGWYGEGNGPSASTMFEGPDITAAARASGENPGLFEGSPAHLAWLGQAPLVQANYLNESAPVSDRLDGALPSGQEGGRWYDGGSPPRIEDYIPQPPPEEEDCSPLPVGKGGAAKGPLPKGYPRSQGRFLVRDLCMLLRFRSSADPSDPGLELEVDRMCLALDSFESTSEYAWRLALSVADIKVFDGSVARTSGNPWRTVFGYCISPQRPRDTRRSMLSMELDAVRPDSLQQPLVTELRLRKSMLTLRSVTYDSCAVLPLRLRLDQNVLAFVQRFLAELSAASVDAIDERPCIVLSDLGFEDDDALEDGEPYFQRVELEGFTLLIDYRPRHVDMAALRDGSLVELANLVPWSGVELTLIPLRLAGCHGWAGLKNAVASEWIDDISSNQVKKFLVGVAPLHALYRVGSAAAQLLSMPAEQLVREGRFYRTLRRGLGRLVRILMLEALSLGASVAGGAQGVLGRWDSDATGSGGSRPEGWREGLLQAGERLSGGLESAASNLVLKPLRSIRSGSSTSEAIRQAVMAAPSAVLAPASQAAAAVRCTLLGAKNSLKTQNSNS